MIGEFLQNATFGLPATIDVIAQTIGATPWEGGWIKLKAILNILSLIFGYPSVIYVITTIIKKYYKNDGQEPTWKTSEIWIFGFTLFFALTMTTSLGGEIWGNIIVWFIS